MAKPGKRILWIGLIAAGVWYFFIRKPKTVVTITKTGADATDVKKQADSGIADSQVDAGAGSSDIFNPTPYSTFIHI